MPIKIISTILIVLLLFLYLDREVELWSTEVEGKKVTIFTDGITKFTAQLRITSSDSNQTVKLFNYYDSAYDWDNYISEISKEKSKTVVIKFHPRLFSTYSKNLYLLDKGKDSILLEGIRIDFIIPTDEEVIAWENNNESLKTRD